MQRRENEEGEKGKKGVRVRENQLTNISQMITLNYLQEAVTIAERVT